MKRFITPIDVALLLAAPVEAQFSKPESAMRYRQAAFTIVNNHTGRISQTAQGGCALTD